MTKMLEDAVLKVSSLPASEQDRLAQLLVEEIASEQRWDDSFSDSQEALETLANEALAEHRSGRTQPLKDLLDEVNDDR